MKLKLNRETIASLSTSEADNVIGGRAKFTVKPCTLVSDRRTACNCAPTQLC